MPAFHNLHLATPRLLLRPLRAADAPALFAIYADPRVMRYWSTPPWPSIAKAHDVIAQDARAMAAGEYVRLGIERRGAANDAGGSRDVDAAARVDRPHGTESDNVNIGAPASAAAGALIGTCTLFDLNAQCRRAEVGYGLAPEAWGRGYMREALRALLTFGFDPAGLDLNRVEADIDPRNTASARVLEVLGFRLEGVLRERWIVEGVVSDSALYGLLRREWRSDGGAHGSLAPPG